MPSADLQVQFATALQTFNTAALRDLLSAGHSWPASLVGLPPWSWVVDNALLRMKGVGTQQCSLTAPAILKGLKEQFELLLQTGQDATLVEHSSRNGKSYGGCLHRLLTLGSAIPSLPHISELAQCVLENVPPVAFTIKNSDGLPAHALLMSMNEWPSAHNVAAFYRAWSAHEAQQRLMQSSGLEPLAARRPNRLRS